MSDLRLNGTAPGGVEHVSAGDDLPSVLVMEIDPPINFSNGQTYSELRVEEPSGKSVQKAEQELAGGTNWATVRNYQFALISNATGVPRGVIEQMRISQINKAFDFLKRFMGDGPQTGPI